MRTPNSLAGLLLSITLLLFSQGGVQAQSDNSYLCEDTGYRLEGMFYDFYRQADQPELIFGHPITGQFTDTLTGNLTQYFEKVRFDLISDEGNETIRVAPLGKLLYEDTGSRVNHLPMSGSCRLFSPSGHRVCYAFIDFYTTHQGEIYFGQPVSEIELRDGRYVQYFENVRLEWQPEHSDGPQVTTSHLGQYYFDRMVGSVPKSSGESDLSTDTKQNLKLQCHAFVENVRLSANNQQSLYVIALDQDYQPVEGVMAGVTVHFPEKDTFYRPPLTGADGISRLNFNVQDIPRDEVITIDISTDYQGKEEKCTAWFRIR